MINHTTAYKKLKTQNQESIDFAVLCCYAVPSLKGYMKAVEHGVAEKLPDPDHFKGEQNFNRYRDIIPNYKKKLGKLLALTFFSYFEAYVAEIIDELFEFHGGFDSLLLKAEQKRSAFFSSELTLKKEANHLREYYEDKKKQKYEKRIAELGDSGFMFPSELFSVFGLTELKKSSSFKSVEIPELLKRCFGVLLTEDEINKFNEYRDLRNNIAHGKKHDVELSEAFAVGEYFRTFALKIDKHLLRHFFVVEL